MIIIVLVCKNTKNNGLKGIKLMPKFKERERKDGRHVIAPRGFNRKRPRKERIEVEYDDESEYSESEEELEFNNGQLIQDNAY